MTTVKLYSYWRSSCSWRVRIALALKEIKYETCAVHLVKDGGEQHTDKYKSLNKMEQLPTLVIDEFTMTQSLPIMEYLDERFPEQGISLLPSNTEDKARVRELCEIINSGIQPLQNLSVIQKVGETKAEWANHFITRGFVAFESLLEKYAGNYCYGNNITMADACLVPQLYGAERFKVDMTKFPIISRVGEKLKSHPAFKAADAFQQPDCPEKQA